MPADRTPADPHLDAVHRAMQAAEKAVSDSEQHVVKAVQGRAPPAPETAKQDKD